MVRRFIQLPPPVPPPPDFWDPPLDAYVLEPFDVPPWDVIEIAEEPVDFSAPETTFTEPFVADNVDWDLIEIAEEPVDFSAAETTFTEPFDVPPWA